MSIYLPEWPGKPSREPPFDVTRAFPDIADGFLDQPEDIPENPTAPFPEPEVGPPTIWSDEMKSGRFYTEYEVTTQIDGDEGLRGAPKAASKGQGQTVIWRKHGGEAVLSVAWIAEKLGDKPVMPHPIIDSTLYVLKSWRIQAISPKPLTDGVNLVYHIRGIYTYFLQVPPELSAFYFPVAASRFHKVNASALYLGPNLYSKEPLAFLSQINPPEITY